IGALTGLAAQISPPFPYTTLSRSAGGSSVHPLSEPRAGIEESEFSGVELVLADEGAFLDPPQPLPDPERGQQLLFGAGQAKGLRSEEHTSELQSRENLVCRLLLEK